MKSFPVCYRINENNSGSSFIVGFGDGLEPLLAGGVPDLHLDLGAVNVEGFDFEIDPNGGDMGHLIFFIDVAQEDIGLADCSVAYYHHLH